MGWQSGCQADRLAGVMTLMMRQQNFIHSSKYRDCSKTFVVIEVVDKMKKNLSATATSIVRNLIGILNFDIGIKVVLKNILLPTYI